MALKKGRFQGVERYNWPYRRLHFESRSGIVTRVFGVVKITRVLKIAGAIIRAVEIRAAKGAGVETSSCARPSKAVL
jgi:hypothetical protein